MARQAAGMSGFDFSDAMVVVTGAGAGIGQGIAQDASAQTRVIPSAEETDMATRKRKATPRTAKPAASHRRRGGTSGAKRTAVTALSTAQDVGAALGSVAAAAARSSMKAAYQIGGDLGAAARDAAKGAMTAAADIGGQFAEVAKSAARDAVKAGGDIGELAKRAAADAVGASGIRPVASTSKPKPQRRIRERQRGARRSGRPPKATGATS